MWAFLGNSLQTGDFMSRGMEAWAWAEPGAGGAEKSERTWGQAAKGIG